MENVTLDPFPSEKNLEHIRKLQGEGFLPTQKGLDHPTAALELLVQTIRASSLDCASVE